MLGRRLTVALILGGAATLFFACATGEADLPGAAGGYKPIDGGDPRDATTDGKGGGHVNTGGQSFGASGGTGGGFGGSAGSVGGSAGSSVGGGGTGASGGSLGGGGTGASGATGGGGTGASGGSGASGATGGSGGSGATGATGGSGGSGATGATSGGGSGGSGATGGGGSGGTGGTTNVVPTTCVQAHGVVGCCGPNDSVYWWECGKLQVGACAGIPCGWDATNNWYSCAGSGFTGSDPSGANKRECGGTTPSPTCPGTACCQGKCNSSTPSPSGCYCDSFCELGGDCCLDACQLCGYGC